MDMKSKGGRYLFASAVWFWRDVRRVEFKSVLRWTGRMGGVYLSTSGTR